MCLGPNNTRTRFFNAAVGRHFLVIIIIIINFFIRVFSEYTEANATTLIPLDGILPEIGTVVIGVSFTVCTKVRLVYWLNSVLADAILIFPRPTLPPIN